MQNIHVPFSLIESAFYSNYKSRLTGHGLSPKWSWSNYNSVLLESPRIYIRCTTVDYCGFCHQLMQPCAGEWQRVYHDPVWVNSNVSQFEHICTSIRNRKNTLKQTKVTAAMYKDLIHWIHIDWERKHKKMTSWITIPFITDHSHYIKHTLTLQIVLVLETPD